MQEDNNKPLNNITPKSIMDRITEDRLNADHRKAVLEEEIEAHKAALNRLFSSPDGQYFLNKLLRYANLTSFDKVLNPAKLVEDRGRQSIWFELIRPYIDKSIRSELDF
jgi:hypothetical protein